MPKRYDWEVNDERGEHVLRLSGMAEGWVIETGPSRFEADLLDLTDQAFLWTAEYASLAAAKRSLVAAAKRFGYPPLSCEPEAPIGGGTGHQRRAESIWEWDEEIYSLCTWIEGNGLGIDGVVTERKDGLFEGDVVLGTIVLREEYNDAWSAKRGVITRARVLVAQAV